MQLDILQDFEPPLIEAFEERWSTPPASSARVRAIRGAPREASWRLLTLVLETLEGKRQIGQLHAMLPGDAYEGILTRTRGSGKAQYRLLRLHTTTTAPGVVEVMSTVRIVPIGRPESWHVKACIGRWEQEAGLWRCKTLRFMGF
ncbi:hypothetical protein JOD54_000231 [Actinokineospora baliensis]|uniref:Rv3235 family protein n=1 Tax=Actinokineospora baliensis TaxID=547056 RepID=UPI00195A05C9|nr:Rv3235 family protein [Actinokineospora baliensis]MBM7770027.1 hypothetical protein [Actinokineospora baliensis]